MQQLSLGAYLSPGSIYSDFAVYTLISQSFESSNGETLNLHSPLLPCTGTAIDEIEDVVTLDLEDYSIVNVR